MTNGPGSADPFEKAFREMGNATLAGLATGALVGGAGGRIVMRVSAIAADSDGLLTENGNRIGDITIGGTLALVIFGGALIGLVGGVVLFAARPWLPRNLTLRTLLFAAVLPLTGLTTVVTSENLDFRTLDPPELNVAMFAGLFAVFGAVVVMAEASLDRILPKSPFGDGAAGPIYAGAVLLAMLAIMLTTLVLFVDGVCGCRAPRLVGVFLVLMSTATVLRAADHAGAARLTRVRRATAPLGYASLVGACVAGSYYAVREIDAIL